MQQLVIWWERALVGGLYLSIALLGIGRLESLFTRGSMSAWSVSRTTFFFWLILKFFLLIRGGWAATKLSDLRAPPPLLFFFVAVTFSLLPDFHQAGDYRYFFFGSMHCLMLMDLFSDKAKLRRVYILLALLPAILAIRGVAHDPAMLRLEEMRRFGYPLDHPNSAGYLFSMTIPMCLALAIAESGRLRNLAYVSCAAQLLALILTYSRGSWLGWSAGMFFFAVILKRKELGVPLVVAGILLSLMTPLRERLFSLVRPQTDVSIGERLQSIEAGVKVGLKHPVLGTGYGRGRLREGLTELYGRGSDIIRIAHTHNAYVELFATTGALGLGTFLWLLGDALYRILSGGHQAVAAVRIHWLGIGAAWIALVVTGLGDVPLYHHDIRILFFSFLALIHLHGRRTSHLQPAPKPQSNV